MGIAIVTLIPTLAEIIVIYAVHIAMAALGVAILNVPRVLLLLSGFKGSAYLRCRLYRLRSKLLS